jgi:hypothetical protein
MNSEFSNNHFAEAYDLATVILFNGALSNA